MLINIKQFCIRYAVSRSTVYREIEAGRLKTLKIGRSTRISEEEAQQWLASLTTNDDVNIKS